MPTDPAQTKVAQEFKHNSPFIACQFDPTGTYVVGAAQDNTLQRFELATGKQMSLVGHGSWVRALAFERSGKFLFAGGFDGKLLVWPMQGEEIKPLRSVEAHTGWIRAAAVSPDGKLLATCGNDQCIKFWNVADTSPVRELKGHEHQVYHIAFHPAGNVLASADLKGVVKIWDLSTGAEIRQLDASVLHKYDATFHADIGGARDMAFSADGKRLACGGITNVSNAFAGIGNPLVVEFNWEEGQPLIQHRGQAPVNGTIWGLAYHADGYLMGASGGGAGGFVYFWKLDGETEFFRFQCPNTARGFSLHPDQQRFAVAHHDQRLRVYTLA